MKVNNDKLQRLFSIILFMQKLKIKSDIDGLVITAYSYSDGESFDVYKEADGIISGVINSNPYIRYKLRND